VPGCVLGTCEPKKGVKKGVPEAPVRGSLRGVPGCVLGTCEPKKGVRYSPPAVESGAAVIATALRPAEYAALPNGRSALYEDATNAGGFLDEPALAKLSGLHSGDDL
jgi:hypothetical protein